MAVFSAMHIELLTKVVCACRPAVRLFFQYPVHFFPSNLSSKSEARQSVKTPEGQADRSEPPLWAAMTSDPLRFVDGDRLD